MVDSIENGKVKHSRGTRECTERVVEMRDILFGLFPLIWVILLVDAPLDHCMSPHRST